MRRLSAGFSAASILTAVLLATAAPCAHATEQPPQGERSAEAAPADTPTEVVAPAVEGKAATDSAVAMALKAALESMLPPATDAQDTKEHQALAEFYAARAYAPLWITAGKLGSSAEQAIAEISNADDWGLKSGDFALPRFALPAGPEAHASAELQLSETLLKYARYARGGRIMDPFTQLNSNLNRVPQLLEPREVLDGVAKATDAAAYLRALHPPQPQFERLRQKYLSVRGRDKVLARRILANMEQWRWMWTDMGDLYLLANVPEFMVHVVKDGHEIHAERIAVGEVGKQTAVFTRTLKHIVLRPMWRVPESIKVRELLPSLRRGGGLMRQHGLQLETKDGQKLDWRTMDWSTTDIRQYEVTQPPGPKSALGKVKFSFPSQYTIYMHDTPDKWMFNPAQRTLTHGCMRLRNPVRLAELLLEADKGWGRAHIDELSRSGPLNNHIAIERKIPFHMTYFTVWVDDDGRVRQFRDVYGHEQRISQALEGQWASIDKGRDALAPVSVQVPSGKKYSRVRHKEAPSGFLGAFLGGE